ncbi:CXXC motif containing zinc binding protein [Trypanosoma melophagium]|uniref:CXXC motif containing zinc binding protein n=1 Tax=Trypanosoma melophagium TaxID=715481 RepID=UPI00351A9931|nr:CXXC motif containing zinc binding protein [Trypanosoma melophagium]
MPLYRVCLSAETDGVVRIRPTQPRNWGLKVKCDACRETSPHFIYVDEAEEHESGGGGTRNAVFKCAFCKAVITVSIDPESYGAFEPDDNGDGGVVTIEVRGGAPEELEMDDKWEVEAEGATFRDVNLGEDWMEYDESSGTTVSVTGATANFHRAKKAK